MGLRGVAGAPRAHSSRFAHGSGHSSDSPDLRLTAARRAGASAEDFGAVHVHRAPSPGQSLVRADVERSSDRVCVERDDDRRARRAVGMRMPGALACRILVRGGDPASRYTGRPTDASHQRTGGVCLNTGCTRVRPGEAHRASIIGGSRKVRSGRTHGDTLKSNRGTRGKAGQDGGDEGAAAGRDAH